jgi:hypothetical protein
MRKVSQFCMFLYGLELFLMVDVSETVEFSLYSLSFA